MNPRSIEEKISTLLVCLESIDLHTLDEINIDNSNNTLKKYLIKNKDYDNKDILITIHKIHQITQKTHNQKIILWILKDYISHNKDIENIQDLTKKYLYRFIYKYKKIFFQSKLKSINYKITSKLIKLAITNLYILYHTSLKEGPYILLKYIGL